MQCNRLEIPGRLISDSTASARFMIYDLNVPGSVGGVRADFKLRSQVKITCHSSKNANEESKAEMWIAINSYATTRNMI